MNTTYYGPLSVGDTAFSADGEKVGEVVEAHDGYFIIEQGIIFTTDLHMPMSTIASRDGDRVLLTLTKQAIEEGDWSGAPRRP